MANQPLDKNKLRKLLFKFYQDNDPVILQQGFDINGLVEFTMEKGLVVLNRMLNKKYGKMIDINEDMGSALQQFNRISQGLTASTYIIGKEQEFRDKLYRYFQKHDPSMVQASRQQQFDKFIKFAMLNGLDKLSEKLKQKYGEGVDNAGETAVEQGENEVDVDAQMFGNSGLNPFGLDVERLRDDLEYFYTQMEDIEQLEVLEETTDWACQIGIEELDKNLEQLYGTSLSTFLESSGRPPHKAVVEEAPPPMPDRRELPPAPDAQSQATEYDIIYEKVQVPAPIREFEEMDDNEIYAELDAFYREHDPDNLENLDRVLELARRIGRQALNKNLSQIYEDVLKPVPPFIMQDVEKKVARPKAARGVPPVPDRNGGAPMLPTRGAPPAVPERNQEYSTFDPPPPKHTNFQPPEGAVNVMMGIGAVKLTPAGGAGGYESDESEHLTEFQKKFKAMNKRINEGKAIVTDGKGNVVMEVNLLIDVCKNYTLDPIEGICKHCGFAKNDHAYSLNAKKGRR